MKLFKITCLLVCFCTKFAYATTNIEFWHALAGTPGDELKTLVKNFNQSQNEYKVKLVYKGDYIETLTSFAAAFRAHKAPQIVQVFEVGKTLMLKPQGAVKPLENLMKEQGEHLPEDDILPALRSFYSVNGEMVALPFNVSLPVMFYNINVLKKVGVISPDDFPKTWQQLEDLSQKLINSGYSCAYTTANPSWVLIESYASLNNIHLWQDNDSKLTYNNKPLTNFLKRMLHWQQYHYFEYGGRVDNATPYFTSGKCPIFSQSSGAFSSLTALSPFKVGMAPMVYDAAITNKRHNNVVGGAAIWAVANLSSSQYKAIAKFYKFLLRHESQKHWHKNTGYLPARKSDVNELLKEESRNPGLAISLLDLAQQDKNLVIEAGPQNQIRNINDQMLEVVFSQLKPVDKALLEARERINKIVDRFLKNTEN